ncbi:tetratricopeptide repeat protein [Nonomuraea sp. H19]|uniref:tetratricopeptide repeat protein n=1 Tax=Nonomuraea sp. H19 TaxID=3452206 RepID=UPI003F8BD3CC
MANEHGTEAARMFRLLGLLESADSGVPVAAALADLSTSEAEHLLDDLVNAQLLQTAAPGRYRLHDLVRLFARERAHIEESADARAQAIRRAVHCYLATARTGLRMAHPNHTLAAEISPQELSHAGIAFSSPEDVREWAREESGNLLPMVRQAVEAPFGRPDLVVALTVAFSTFMDDAGLWREQLDLARIGVTAAEHTGDLLHQAATYVDIGWAQMRLGQLSDAVVHLKSALSAYRRIGRSKGEAASLTNLAAVFRRLALIDESISHYRQALELYRRIGDAYGQGASLSGLGLAYQKIGRLAEAIDAHARAVAIIRELGQDAALALALGNLAAARRLAGDPKGAIACFQEALAIDHEFCRGSYREAELLWGLGRALHDVGEPEPARRCWWESARILYDLGLITADQKHAIEATTLPQTPSVIDGWL